MSWHYQVRKRVVEGVTEYEIVEMYDGTPGWTDECVSPYGETLDELLTDITRMLHDAQHYPVFEEPSKEHDGKEK